MMRPPAINLARRPFRNNTAYYAVYAACAALLMAATAYNVWSFVSSGDQLEQLRADVTFVNDRYMQLYQDVDTIKKELSGLDLTVINTKSSFADGLIVSRFFSWSKLFDNMEELIPPEVKVQRIAPAISTKRIEITLTGMARSPQAFLEFEANLSESLFFSNVYPLREDQQESQNELKFSLVMDYIPAGKDTLEAEAAEAAQSAAPPAGGTVPVAEAPAAPSAGEPGAPDVSSSSAAESQAVVPAPAVAAPGGQLVTSPAATSPAQPAAPVPSGAQAAAPAPPTAEPEAESQGAASLEMDPTKLTDEEFIKRFGRLEFINSRVIPRNAGKARAKAKAGQGPAPVADPNAQVKP